VVKFTGIVKSLKFENIQVGKFIQSILLLIVHYECIGVLRNILINENTKS